MHVIQARNVREALPLGLLYLSREGRLEDSRAGAVVIAPGPVTTVYERPTERVLLSPVRDANPFFGLAESIWMLAGRRDAAFLNEYVKDFGERFAEPGGEIHDAYGWRWREMFGFDQLNCVIETLRKDPASRQCVIQMWSATPGEMTRVGSAAYRAGEEDLRGSWKTRPCNTHIYLRVRWEHYNGETLPAHDSASARAVLDITVCCRSNDMIMGGYGANAVHFSILQEYLAARIGVGVGTYYQLSNNYHVYCADVRRMCARKDPKLERAKPHERLGALSDFVSYPGRYEYDLVPTPLFEDVTDEDIQQLVVAVDALHRVERVTDRIVTAVDFRKTNLQRTVWNALLAHRAYRLGHLETALLIAKTIVSPDWERACREWLERRVK